MNEHLHEFLAAVLVALALLLGCIHEPDPSYDPANAVPYREDP